MRVIETAWQEYQEKVIPPGAPEIQISESKKAFYAGAGCLLDSICKILGPGQEPTESDLLIMDGIAEELKEFVLKTTERCTCPETKLHSGESEKCPVCRRIKE